MRGRLFAAGSVVGACLAALVAAGCGGGDGSTQTTAATTAAATARATSASAPSATLDPSVIDAAKREGRLVLYTNADNEQLGPLIKSFNETYPDIKVEALSLGSNEVFQRYLSESATGSPTADVLLASNQTSWQGLLADGKVLDWEDPNVADLPEYAKLGQGVTAMSEDPAIVVYNKALLPEDKWPATLAGLADMAPELKDRIGTVDVKVPLQLETTATYVDAAGDAGWASLDKLGPASKVESSNGSLVTKLAQGQYAAAFFVSGAVRALLTGDAAKLIGWRYLTDATVVIPRAIGITKDAKSPNAAKVLVNWVLSVPGQQAGCAAGFTPYREGVDCPLGLSEAIKAVGQDKVIIETYDGDLGAQRDQIVDRWNTAFGR